MHTDTPGLSCLAESAAVRFGSAVAQRWRSGEQWCERDFAELARAVARVAGVLHGIGVQPGDRVALWCRTRPEWTVVDLAIARLGAICVPVYPTSASVQVRWILADSGARVVITETAYQEAVLAELRADLEAVETVLTIEHSTLPGPALRDVIDRPDAPPRLPAVEPAAAPIYTIVYTSGTTGAPKGCVLTHANMAAVLASLQSISEVGVGDVLFAYLPLAHLLTRMLQAFCLTTGATIAYSSGDIREIVPDLIATAPTHLPSVPALFEKVYATVRTQAAALGKGEESEDAVRGLVKAVFGGRIREALSGGAPISPEILEFFHTAEVPVYEAYGMTESTAVISANVPGAWRVGSVGRPVPGVEVRIAPDGEVLARGAGVFDGYWGDPAATAETVVDGWLHTGDLGRLDADGFLTITGRKKDIIITSAGKNLSPAAIEGDLRRTRFVAEAVLIGDHRPYPVGLLSLDVEVVAAWAASFGVSGDAALDDPRLIAEVGSDVDTVNARYSPPERLRRFAIAPRPFSIEAGELTPTLKVRRAVVAEHFHDLIDSLYGSQEGSP